MRKKQEKQKKESSPKIQEITDEEAMELQADIDKKKEIESKGNTDENHTEKDTKLVVSEVLV